MCSINDSGLLRAVCLNFSIDYSSSTFATNSFIMIFTSISIETTPFA